MKVLTVLGTRPEIIKMSPLLPLFDQHFTHNLVHTGQHYAYHLDRIFFNELHLRTPDYTLEVGSADNLVQTASMMAKMDPVIKQEKPDLIVVQGDTNSTLAGALAAVKSGVYLAHIEAGCRSFNRDMPEEYNRVLTDHSSHILFAPHQDAVDQLKNEGVPEDSIFLTGNTLIDACMRNVGYSDASKILKRLRIDPGEYILVTIHRSETTDNAFVLKELITTLNSLADRIPIVFPIHPRTKKALHLENLELDPRMEVIDPVGYLDFLKLVKSAKFIMTDSGGIQEEAAGLHIPALILRDETEWMDFVRAGKNRIVGKKSDQILKEAIRLLDDPGELEKMKAAEVHLPVDASKKILDILTAFSHDL
jgi:UDP-N-acetylglucosamine 2-epimerase (non-hydrolysing)